MLIVNSSNKPPSPNSQIADIKTALNGEQVLDAVKHNLDHNN